MHAAKGGKQSKVILVMMPVKNAARSPAAVGSQRALGAEPLVPGRDVCRSQQWLVPGGWSQQAWGMSRQLTAHSWSRRLSSISLTGRATSLGRAQPWGAGPVLVTVSPPKVQFPSDERLGRREGGRHVDRHIIQNRTGYLLLRGERVGEGEEGRERERVQERQKGTEKSRW